SASCDPYRSARQPTATTRALPDAAPSSSAMDSCFAASMKPHVLTRTTFASPASSSPASVQPAASSRPASSSESTSLRAQPRVTRLTVRSRGGGFSMLGDTPADYGKTGRAQAAAPGRQPDAWAGSFLSGPKLSVTGWPTAPGRPSFVPFTVSRIPPGLPICMLTSRGNVRGMLVPPATYAWDGYLAAGWVTSGRAPRGGGCESAPAASEGVQR